MATVFAGDNYFAEETDAARVVVLASPTLKYEELQHWKKRKSFVFHQKQLMAKLENSVGGAS